MNIKRGIRIIAAAVCVSAIIFGLCACGDKQKSDYPSPTEKFFVNDFAGVITDSDAETIYTEGVALNEKTGAQAVVVTVESLNGKAIADYALELGREWGVGQKGEDNGVVLLFAKEDREVYIAVGDKLEGALNDSKVGRILDNYGIPYFSEDNFSQGLVSTYNSIVNEVYIENGIEPDENYTLPPALPQSVQDDEDISASKVLISWVVLMVIVAVYLLIFGRRGLIIFGSPRFFGGGFNNRGGFGGGGFGGGGFTGGGGGFSGGGAGRKF